MTSAKVISLHGRKIDALVSCFKKAEETILILTDNDNNPEVIWQLYQQLKSPIIYDFWLCENLGGDDEKISKINKKSDINLLSVSSLNILVLQQNKNSNNNFLVKYIPHSLH